MPKLTRRGLLVAGAALAPAQALVAKQANPASRSAPGLTLAFEAHITLAPPVEYGSINGSRKRFIAITGGTVSGERLNGVVLAGGGDWQTIHPDGLTEIHARYALKADDGTVIAIDNPGVRVAAPEIIARLSAGEDVDPALYYFRTTPSFDVPTGRHDWLKRQVFVARGIRRPDHVVLEFYSVS
jgi:Protein of unknown function (DUF3237)